MLHLLKRHPIAIEAKFDYTLVLTDALPVEILQPLRNAEPRLASAFYIENIPYRWKEGIRENLANPAATASE